MDRVQATVKGCRELFFFFKKGGMKGVSCEYTKSQEGEGSGVLGWVGVGERVSAAVLALLYLLGATLFFPRRQQKTPPFIH